jgi:hypothetical protein
MNNSTTLIVATWARQDSLDISKSMLVRSFKKHNPLDSIYHIHFNRINYAALELEFAGKYGYQFEFILYRIFLLRDALKKAYLKEDFERVVFCDTSDVICQGSIQDIPNSFDLDSYVIFGAEKNQWPGVKAKKQWANYNDYSSFDLNNRYFINAGVVLSKLELFIDLLDQCVYKALPTFPRSLNTLAYAGDQGVYTYYYNNLNSKAVTPKIKLDYGNFLALNTFSTSLDDYYFHNEKVYSNHTGVAPVFVHDNGCNHHGSPRLTQVFNLNKLYEDET